MNIRTCFRYFVNNQGFDPACLGLFFRAGRGGVDDCLLWLSVAHRKRPFRFLSNEKDRTVSRSCERTADESKTKTNIGMSEKTKEVSNIHTFFLYGQCTIQDSNLFLTFVFDNRLPPSKFIPYFIVAAKEHSATPHMLFHPWVTPNPGVGLHTHTYVS
jgi:hypothetical protein